MRRLWNQKLWAVALLLCVLFAVAGCSDAPASAATSSASSAESTPEEEESVSSAGESSLGEDSSSSESPASSAESSKENTEESVAESGTESESSIAPESSATKEKNTEVVSAFEKFASFQDFWYEGGNAAAAMEDVLELEDGSYCRYETSDIGNYAEFEAKALSLMTDVMFANLQKRICYVEKNSALYGPQNFGRGDKSGFAGYECETEMVSETEYQLKADAYYYATAFDAEADPESRVLTAEITCTLLLQDGKWKVSATEYVAYNGAAG